MARLRDLPSPSARPQKSSLKSLSISNNRVSRPVSQPATSKKDKRRIKHEQLISKVTKSITKPRRRRPNKKLLTTLESLAEALPDDENPSKKGAGEDLKDQVNVIRRKSVTSKPGALKRREKVDRGERHRFAQNMAQLAQPPAAAVAMDGVNWADSSISRSAALRAFISQTLEQRPDFKLAPNNTTP